MVCCFKMVSFNYPFEHALCDLGLHFLCANMQNTRGHERVMQINYFLRSTNHILHLVTGNITIFSCWWTNSVVGTCSLTAYNVLKFA